MTAHRPARARRWFGLLACALLGSSLPLVGGSPARAATSCNAQSGTTYTDQPWAQQRLDFVNAWPITKGRGVTVAVIDSGLVVTAGHLDIDVAGGKNVIAKADPPGTADCFGHGTEVASIIAASKTDSRFLGVAPQARILVVKYTSGTDSSNPADGSQDSMSKGIRYAVDAGAEVINISAVIDAPRSSLRELEKAVRYARQHGVVIVAAAGNSGSQSNQPGFPAAFSPYEDNVIAVSATDSSDAVSAFSESGNYVTVAAPGVNDWVPAPHAGYLKVSGTSYAAPYVSGTVALMLAANPQLRGHPDLVRNQLIATADAPPVAVPSRTYGYGIINPYLAVTSLGVDQPRPTATARPAAVAAPRAPAHPDHRLAHIALGVGLGLLGLAALTGIAAGVIRASRRAGARRTA